MKKNKAIAAMVLLAQFATLGAATGQSSSEFTYQGELKENSLPVTGSYNLEFSLWDDAIAGNQLGSTNILNGVSVSAGRFAVILDFGVVPYTADPPLWLEITVSGTALWPRQILTPTPYSLATRGIQVDSFDNVGVAGDLRGEQRVAIGNDAFFGLGNGPYPAYDRIHDFSHQITDFTSTPFWSPLLSVFTLDPATSLGGSQVYANSFEVHTDAANNQDFALVNGLFGASLHRGSGIMSNSYGAFLHSGIEGAGDITFNSGVVATAGSSPGATGSIFENIGVSVRTFHGGGGIQTTNNYGIHVGTPFGQEPIEANFGIFVDDQNVAVGTNYAIFVQGGRVQFNDDLFVTGNVSKGGGSFKIDHPLDPANKYLYHSFVESPDMMNIYNGNITTDSQGYATIEMPDGSVPLIVES